MSIGSFLTRIRQQTATYWANTGPDGFGGYNYDSPITIDVKWFDDQSIVIDGQGKEVLSKSTAFVDRVITENSYLALGDYTDSAYEEPTGLAEARIVLAFTSFMDVNNVDWVYVARMK